WSFNCPPDFVAVPALAVAGGAIGNSAVVGITRSHGQSACLFAAVAGGVGTAKTPAALAAAAPLEGAEGEHLRSWQARVQGWPVQLPEGAAGGRREAARTVRGRRRGVGRDRPPAAGAGDVPGARR